MHGKEERVKEEKKDALKKIKERKGRDSGRKKE